MDVRSLGREAFVARFGGVFEHSAWVPEQAWDKGLDDSCATPEGLHRILCAIVERAPEATQLALLRAHPDLAGRLALAGKMTAESIREQAGAGLSSLSEAELSEFTALNDEYTSRFGFPFIISVRGLDKQGILEAFKRRVKNSPAVERKAAIEQVERIALMRLRDLMAA
jgi:OHCU decarboxylase